MEGPRPGNALSLVPIRRGVFPNVTLSPSNLSFAATLYLTEKQEQARLASAGEDYEPTVFGATKTETTAEPAPVGVPVKSYVSWVIGLSTRILFVYRLTIRNKGRKGGRKREKERERE